MHEGPKDSVKTCHAELSERISTSDMWADILRKAFIAAIISFTVWAGCALMRYLVGIGTEWLFETAEAYHTKHTLMGGVVILVIMLIAGFAHSLLLFSSAWEDAEGDGIDKSIIMFHQTYQGDGSDSTARHSEPRRSFQQSFSMQAGLFIGC